MEPSSRYISSSEAVMPFSQISVASASVIWWTPDGKRARFLLIAVVGAVERPASHTDVSAAVGALADDRSHIYRTVIRQFKYGREGLAFLGGKAVQQDTAFLQQLRHFPVTHLAVADDAVDVEPMLCSQR